MRHHQRILSYLLFFIETFNHLRIIIKSIEERMRELEDLALNE